MMQQQNNNTTPSVPEFVTTNLISSGSKLSAKEIYKRQIELPLYGMSNQYYKATDVDNLFTIFNGVISSMAEESERTKKVNDDLRKEIDITNTVANDLAEQVIYLKSQLETLQLHESDVDTNLQIELKESQDAYKALVTSTADKMVEAQHAIDELDSYKSQLQNVITENTQLSESIDDLQSKITLLSVEKTNSYNTIENQNTEIKQYLSEISKLSQELDSKNNIIDGLTNENSMLQLKIGRVIDASKSAIAKALATRK